MTDNDLLSMGLTGLLMMVVAVAMLSSLRVSLALAVASIPLEEVFVFEAVGTLSKLVMLGLAASFVFHIMRGRLVPRWRAFPLIGWLWLSWACASLFWTANAQVDLVLTLVQLVLMAAIFAGVIAARPSLAPTIMWSYLISASVLAVLALNRFFATAATLGPQRTSAVEDQGVAHFGAVLMPALVMTVLLGLHPSKSKRQRIAFLILAVVLTFGILVSGTRSAWVAAGTAVVAVVLPSLKWRQLLVLLLSSLLVVLAASRLPALSDFVTNRSTSAVATGGAGRVDIWKVGVGLIQRAPFLGVGFGEFKTNFDAEAIRNPPYPSDRVLPSIGRASHSLYLANVVELGLPGFVLFIAWMGSLMIRLRGSGVYLVIFRATLLAYLIQGIFLDVLNRKYFWLFVGLAEGCRWLFNATRDARGRRPAQVPQVSVAPNASSQ